jgi:uncharacterized membrane protein YedE/YeeE
MMISWQMALLGGILIGLSATLLLWANGRIAGISGIVNGVMNGPRAEWAWRIAFVAGLMGAGAVTLWWHNPAPGWPAPGVTTVVAGLLVGFGTRLGNGCTSGHGVCGLGRLSPRSLAAVLVFVATAMVTVFIVRHVLGVGP